MRGDVEIEVDELLEDAFWGRNCMRLRWNVRSRFGMSTRRSFRLDVCYHFASRLDVSLPKMLIKDLVQELGFGDSPYFLRKGTRPFATAPHIGHILRTAAKSKGHHGPSCSVYGAYVLRENLHDKDSAQIPLVYVCEAKTEEEADQIHRLVWNQDAVPFLIVHTPEGIKFYSGFEYTRSGNGILSNLLAFNEATDLIREFHRDEIDSGKIWAQWSKKIRPERRVNRKLLDNLSRLDKILQNDEGLSRETSHALIGKYVYLRYLRDRDILSDRMLESWGVSERDVFGRNATLAKFKIVVHALDDWLNGNIFPVVLNGPNAPSAAHIRLVAGVFKGDDVLPSGDRQLTLDFQAYDFSYIPIETLSIVYEQFLHQQDASGKSKGREEGAYYTPIPIVNLMISEMEERNPLSKGVTVFDPACGSGAFLVQSYRRLIEKTFSPHEHSAVHPIELRNLLVDHIFGLDRDPDACSVTELSLILTLLDYVDPPDLQNDKRIKLPVLRHKNIFHADFFDDPPRGLRGKRFNWVIGNPPWKKLSPKTLRKEDKTAWNWMQENENDKPVGGYQLARAFTWRVENYVSDTGEVGLFLPAMTLFDKQAVRFRRKFFRDNKVSTVANFSNLAEVLAPGRFRVASAALFFSMRDSAVKIDADEHIRFYSPLIANQEAIRPSSQGERQESWCIVINDAEIEDVPLARVANGLGTPWKMAAWGSHFDSRLLSRLGKRFPSVDKLRDDEVIEVDQGPDLSAQPMAHGTYETEYFDELIGKKVLNVKNIARLRHIFTVPDSALESNDRYYVSKRSGVGKLRICRSPHVIVSAARIFAIYVEDYLVVPSRQIGITSQSDDRDFLKALSLYLSSDFAFYHQFFTSTEFGVKRDRATLASLLQMPMPLAELSRAELSNWVKLHNRLIKTTPRRVGVERPKSAPLFPDEPHDDLDVMLTELNGMVFDCLQLDERERALVNDLVHVRLELNDGKLGAPAIRHPGRKVMKVYARRLKKELDAYIGEIAHKQHNIDVVYDDLSGMIQIDVVKKLRTAAAISVAAADDVVAKQLAKTRDSLRQEAAQWVYFDRDLKMYNGTKTFLFKPMQRFHWTESQAMIDANEIIAETLCAQGEPV